MKNRLFSVLFFLLNLSVIQAQNGMSVGLEPIDGCGCDGCFIVFISNAQGPFELQWSNGQINTMNGTQELFCGFCPGTYVLTVTDFGTMQTDTVFGVLQDIPFIPLEITAINPALCNNDSISGGNQVCDQVCAGTTVTYSVSSLGNPSSNFVSWQVSGANSWVVDPQNGDRVIVNWGNPGNGSLSVVSSSPNGCTSEDYICVTILEPPSAQIASNPAAAPGTDLQVCIGQTVDFQNISTGDADYIEWFFSDDFSSSTAQEPQHTYLNPGIHTVTLIARSSCLCPDTTSMTVEVLDAEAPTLDCVATICPGETVTYNASNACAPFSWTISPNGTILEGGTATSDSITVQWIDGPNGTISLMAAACAGATCPTAGIINIPIISDNAEIRGKERVCPNATEVYSIESFGGSGFDWTLSGGGVIMEGQGTNRVSIKWQSNASNTTYILSVKYDNCYLGCGGEDSIAVNIVPSFVVNGPAETCLNTNSTFTSKLTSNNAAISCNWTLTGPSGMVVWTSAAANSSVSVPFMDGPGYYRLLAIPANPAQSCSNQADWAVHVNPLPSKLTGIKGERRICPGITYTYEAEGGTPQSNYFWTLQNGAGAPITSYGKTFNVTWNASGPYWLSVAHVSLDGLACQSDTVQIQVAPIGIPNITGVPDLCEDSKGSYSIDPLQNVDLQWEISPPGAGSVADGQGTIAAEIFWSQAGVHAVNLKVCGETAVFPVTVNALPYPMVQAPVGLCPGATDLVQTSSSFNSYIWKDATGALLSNTATMMLGPGTYAVEVTDMNGCAGTQEFYIDSWDAPDVSLTTASPTGFCNNSLFVPLTALTNNDGNYSFQWFQDGTLIPGQTGVTYSTNQYGLYTVQATNAHGCTTEAGPINLFPYCGGGGQCTGQNCSGSLCPPGTIDMAIDATPRCDSFQLQLLDPTNVLVPGSQSWIVGISGGLQLGSSSDIDPSFVMNNAGEYVAILNVQMKNGDFCHVFDFFSSEAVARIDAITACPGDATDFQDVSEFLPTGGITNWDWTFGDPASGPNNQSVVRNPAHIYDPSGPYQVNLTVTGISGCTSSATAMVDIPAIPAVNFAEPALKCAGNALEFIPPPNAADITEISWDFGDPASGASNDATGSPAYHNFSPAGNYTVSVTAKNIYGCTASFTRNLVIPPNNLSGTISPAIPPAICEGKSISLGAPAGAVSYLWSDDNASTSAFITVVEEGTYRVTITDANGCTYAPPAVNVEVNAAPDALIKALVFNELNQIIGTSYPSLAVCEGEDVVLEAIANTSVNYNWSVSNGNSPFLHFTEDRNNLLTTGNYLYSVTVTNPATGCTTETSPFSVSVNPVPSGFSISGDNTCAGSPITITYNGPQPPNWQMIWNTGLSGTVLNTEAAGAYQIRVINEFGCEARSNEWTVLPGPPVNAIPAGCHTRCKPDTLCLPNLPTVVAWQWFQDGIPIPGATTSDFVAQESGTYWAQLTDFWGCSAQSDPLSLNLYDGYGNILGQVWSDVNNNGVIDAADTLVSDMPVILYQNGVLFDAAKSGLNGGFAFPNVLSTDYVVEIDEFSLPANWHTVIGQDAVTLAGCDVEGTVDLLLRYGCQAFGTLELSGCAGATVTYQGTIIPVGATQSFQYTSPQGCDSTLVVTVLALQPSTGSVALTACAGTSAVYNGTNIPAGTSQTFTYMNAVGCDSVVTVIVQSLANSPGSATLLFACIGGSAMYNGVNIPAGTVQPFTLQNAQGCDSVVTVTVVALPPATGTETLYACPGGTATYGGSSIPVGTSQDFTLQNWLGCDSVVTVNVLPLTTSTGTATLHACPGGAATYAGTSIPVGGTQDFALQNAQGCDSIVTVNVLAWPTSSSSLEVGVCPGETYTYQGVTLAAGSVAPFVLQNWLGCDSTVTLTVKQLQTSTNLLQVNVCPGESYLHEGVAIPGGQARDFHFSNAEGCDSTLTVQVQEFPASSFMVQAQQSCANAPTGSLEATVDPGGQAPFRYSLDNLAFQNDNVFSDLDAGTYQVFLEDANGCIYERGEIIPVIPALEIVLNNDILPCDSAGIMLVPALSGGDPTSLSVAWWDGTKGSTAIATEAGLVWVEATDLCGTARSEARIELAALAEDLGIVYVPNVMMPSAQNPENAAFRPVFAADVTPLNYKFMVFDRWGNELFETENTGDAWDGVFGSQNLNPGVQVWYLEVDVEVCGRVLHVVKKGDVTVLR